jgi:hypothetical protein
MTLAAIDATDIEGARRRRGLPNAPPEFTPTQRTAFEKTADALIADGVTPAVAAETARDKALGRGLFARPEEVEDNKGVTIGGALSLALAMPDLQFVSKPIFTKGQIGTFTGHPGHCKSTFMDGLCTAHALELPFGPITPEARGLVYIVSAEDFQGTRNRILAEAARLRLDPADRAKLDATLRWVHVDTNVGAMTIREAIDTDALGQPIALIFVDTGPALFCGDDENDNVALRNFVEGFAAWKTLPGNPVTVLAWHPSKGATADRLEPRGASAIKGTIDFNLTIWRDDDRVTLSYTKVRAQHFDPIEGKISSVELEAASGARYSAPVVTVDADEPAERSDAREAREAIIVRMYATRTNPPTVRDLAAATSMSRAACGRHLQHMVSSKPAMVIKDPVDERYSLTPKGVERGKLLAGQSKQGYGRARDPG